MAYKPKFIITPEINNRIARIERIKLIVESSRILPQQEIALRHRAAVDAVHSSTTIEGNPLKRQEVVKVLAGKPVPAPERAVIEVVNYKRALDWLIKRQKQPVPISIRDVLHLHSLTMVDLLPGQKIGRWRLGPVYIVDVKGGRDYLRYTGPKAGQVKKLVNELLVWLERKGKILYPVLAAAILHYEFVSIHPFSDGNGRVTRLLTLLFLRLSGYGFRDGLIPDVYYLQFRRQYYQALSLAKIYRLQRRADLTPWIDYFTKGFLTAAEELKRNITLVTLPNRPGKTIEMTDEEITLLDFGKTLGKVDLQNALEILELPRRTVQRRLSALVKKGLLVKIGKGKNLYYKIAGV